MSDAELLDKVTREINNVTLMYRADNLHEKLAEKIIKMVRQHDELQERGRLAPGEVIIE